MWSSPLSSSAVSRPRAHSVGLLGLLLLGLLRLVVAGAGVGVELVLVHLLVVAAAVVVVVLVVVVAAVAVVAPLDLAPDRGLGQASFGAARAPAAGGLQALAAAGDRARLEEGAGVRAGEPGGFLKALAAADGADGEQGVGDPCVYLMLATSCRSTVVNWTMAPPSVCVLNSRDYLRNSQ